MDIYLRRLQNKYNYIFELEPRDWIDEIHAYPTTNYLQFLLTTVKYNVVNALYTKPWSRVQTTSYNYKDCA